MSEPDASEEAPQITFNVKANEAKYSVTLPTSATISNLKQKLATSEYADIPPERQRLIFSGRVLKDNDTISSVNIKEGHTVHMVRGAASNARQTPTAQSSSSTSTSSAAAANIPTNIAAGTGNNPLAGLTGARYAGFHGLPNASDFGADGGMGPPVSPDEMLRQLENPNFAQQMNEVMNNPMIVEMLENTPMFRDNPLARQMIRDPNIRRMMFDPNVIRAQLQMQRQMGGTGLGGAGSSFPAPGVTDTTPQTSGSETQTQNQPENQTQNPLGQNALFPGLNLPTGTLGAGNPFAALFNPAAAAGSNATSGTTDSTSTATADNANQTQQPARNPLAELMAGLTGNQNQNQTDPLSADPALIRSLLGGLTNPQTPPDNRPPEERYAEQLRQLNDMGFYEFERNIEALRRSGGSVQGAVEYLLTHPGGS